MSRGQTKAAQYIQQLDEARCEGNWDAVPELVRKIKKHAPQRTCLVTTAEAEHAISRISQSRPSTARPSTAGTTISAANTAASQPIAVSQYIPLLLEAIEKETTHVEDEFQAQVCLGWIYWQIGEHLLAVAQLPDSIEQEFSRIDGINKESSEWTKVCALKALYIKGQSQGKAGAMTDSIETFSSGLPILAIASSSPQQSRELKSWSELYLTGFCIQSSHAIKSRPSSILETETLSAFRAWAKSWDTQTSTPIGGKAFYADVSRRHVWKEYYLTLSDVLKHNLPFPTTALTTAYAETSTRLQQRAELKRVEARYETLLLSEVLFPKAEEASEEVESFVEIVMQNWRILCGSGWHEHDLGEGGSEAVSKGVLDILYRAATKTFHSTAILRHLFTVHLAVAEFNLAFKAFDTYLDIVKKGKARVEKTGETEHGLDEDETVLIAASECIKALCRYGSLEGARKARDLGQYFEGWLDKHHPGDLERSNGNFSGNRDSEVSENFIQPKIFALAWRSIGIAHAQWARLTYEASSRPDIQLHAIKCFRKALLPQFESTRDVETLFALGTILAERRELPAAIEVVKTGLLPRSSTATANELGPLPGRFSRERSLIPLWHLMALLLSARQEFATATRSCEGAFEQFQDPKYLFGEADLNGAYRSAHLNENANARKQGVVDDMDDFEKESVLEVKMTQLAIIEVLEGPEVAVNASDELLSLYSRLFGDPLKDSAPLGVPSTALTVAPQSSAGTIRSVRGSIFGRSGRSVRKTHTDSATIDEDHVSPPRPQTTQTVIGSVAPTIQVTNENGGAARQHSSQHHHEKLQKRSDSVLNKDGTSRSRSVSTGRKHNGSSQKASEGHVVTTLDGDSFFTPPSDTGNRKQLPQDDHDHGKVGGAASATISHRSSQPKALLSKTQQLAHREPSLRAADSNSGFEQDNRLPHMLSYSSSTTPITRFPKDQERRRRAAILVKVWLLISGFYRRASMYDDARGALEEAEKLVRSAEADVSKDASGNISVNNAGWGGGKTVQQLWADVFSERGLLSLEEAIPHTALAHFESALTRFPDHPSAIIGLSNILLDIYTEDLLPPPAIPSLVLPGPISTPSASSLNNSTVTPLSTQPTAHKQSSTVPVITHGPLGHQTAKPISAKNDVPREPTATPNSVSSKLQPSYKESSTALLDRLAARDRAYGLLTTLTKLGTGWNNSEAWFALSRAYEEGGQPDKAREVLWWCVDLEESRAIRDWTVAGGGGYVL
ncbi:hypothetical protein WAI453_005150 [Rhynchosporium graminicola]